MANVTIHTHPFSPMAIDAPSHCLIYFATHAMHLSNLAVTGRAFEAGSNVRLVRVENICLRLVPIHATPRRLLFLVGERGKLLHFGTLGHYRIVTSHASGGIGNGGVRRLVYILVTEGALELRAFFLCHMLPVVELNWLLRRFRLA